MTTFVRRRAPRRSSGVVLGIDASYSGFGLVSLNRDSQATSVHGVFDRVKGPDRLLQIESWLIEQLSILPPVEHICMENYAPGAKFGREKAGELGGLVKLTLRRWIAGDAGYPTLVVPMQLKVFVTGSGKGSKDQVTKEVLRKWGYNALNNDVADAYGLAKAAQALQWGADSCLAYEKALLGRLTRHTEHPDNDSATVGAAARARSSA